MKTKKQRSRIPHPYVLIVGIVLLISLTTACASGSNPLPPTAQVGQMTPTTPPTHTPTPSPTPQVVDRHGLAENVPLPNDITFKSRGNFVSFQASNVKTSSFSTGCASIPTNQTWVWTVASPNGPATVQQFYQNILPGKGWSSVHVKTACQGGNSVVASCGSTTSQQLLLVQVGSKITLMNQQGNPTSTVVAPGGGSALAIALVSNEHGKTDPNLGIFIPKAADVFCS